MSFEKDMHHSCIVLWTEMNRNNSQRRLTDSSVCVGTCKKKRKRKLQHPVKLFTPELFFFFTYQHRHTGRRVSQPFAMKSRSRRLLTRGRRFLEKQKRCPRPAATRWQHLTVSPVVGLQTTTTTSRESRARRDAQQMSWLSLSSRWRQNARNFKSRCIKTRDQMLEQQLGSDLTL